MEGSRVSSCQSRRGFRTVLGPRPSGAGGACQASVLDGRSRGPRCFHPLSQPSSAGGCGLWSVRAASDASSAHGHAHDLTPGAACARPVPGRGWACSGRCVCKQVRVRLENASEAKCAMLLTAVTCVGGGVWDHVERICLFSSVTWAHCEKGRSLEGLGGFGVP